MLSGLLISSPSLNYMFLEKGGWNLNFTGRHTYLAMLSQAPLVQPSECFLALWSLRWHD